MSFKHPYHHLHTIADRETELKNWLSTVISYQQTCMDGFTQPELPNAISTSLLNATKLTDNALAIVAAISDILSAFNIPIGNTTNTKSAGTAASRRLLEANDNEKEAVHNTENGYPAFLSSSDRKLLAARSNNAQPPPNAVVTKDGSGQYNTIAAAVAAYPKNLKGRYIIYVKAGIYDEYITVTKDQVNIFMYGDGPRKTIVTGQKYNRDGVSTYQSASFKTSVGKNLEPTWLSSRYFSLSKTWAASALAERASLTLMSALTLAITAALWIDSKAMVAAATNCLAKWRLISMDLLARLGVTWKKVKLGLEQRGHK
ncbi:hypothetical protein K7X08_010496 [Anisodus acutangulus]|uniref:Pectinesterase n=1 Tax=Anisodus acutangulus TaxID=402998 RepID=A0A9Q1N5A4_9SOLA|nr:hypothetical protein K7X08_010496 [Anisodus acutangulus]